LGGLNNLPPVTVGHGLEPSTKKDWLPTGSKTRSLALEKVKPTTSRPKPFRPTLKALYHAEIAFPVNFPQMIQPT
jgi:hypothetical protein